MSKLKDYNSDSFKNFFDSDLSTTDPSLYNSIKLELQRQQEHIELNASENIDICREMFDGDGMDSDIDNKLDFTLAEQLFYENL